MYKNNSGLIAKTKVKYLNQTTVTKRKVSAQNPLLFLYETVAHNTKELAKIEHPI